jgi:hypothetical protein
MGISEATFYVWKKKYSGIGPSELRRLRQLEDENRKLKQIVADLSLDKAMLQAVVAKSLRPSHRRELVPELMQRFGCSQRNALRVVQMSASTYLYRSVARDATALKLRIKEITEPRVHYGYRRVHVMLRREGYTDNVKRVYRLYREEGLSLRLKRPRRNKAAKLRQPKQLAFAVNEIWSMDFVADALFDGRKLRMLTVVDCYTRECLAIDVGQSLKGESRPWRPHSANDPIASATKRSGQALPVPKTPAAAPMTARSPKASSRADTHRPHVGVAAVVAVDKARSLAIERLPRWRVGLRSNASML